ncbi:MAG TPA: hypothetical protein VKW78_17810 [Terriglobales bacterium]|nr:hypothetical protein [Terriglobales bacterium]
MMKTAASVLLLLFTIDTMTSFAANPNPDADSAEGTVGIKHMFAPYWITEGDWHTELQLRNNMPNTPLTVTPVLQTASGQSVKLAPVTIPGNEVRSVDVNAAVADPINGVTAPFYGSIDIQYNARFHGNLFAAEMVGIMGQPVMFHLDPTGLDPDYTAGSIDGFWWNRHTGVQDVLVLSNNASAADTAHLVLSDANGNQWANDYALGPHSIVRLNALELATAAKFTSDFGGIHIVAGHPGSFDAVHFMYDTSKGFSALMKMFYYDAHTTKAAHAWSRDEGWMLWAPMLALQTPDPALLFPASVRLQPIIFLQNLASKPANAQIRLYWCSASDTGKTNPQTVILKAGDVQKLDVASQFKDLPSDANWERKHRYLPGRLCQWTRRE